MEWLFSASDAHVQGTFVYISRQAQHDVLLSAVSNNILSIFHKMVSLIKRTAVSLHLIPGSMKSNQWLTRIFYWKLAGLPAELGRETIEKLQGGQTGPEALMPISSETSTGQFKVIYAVGWLP